MANPFDEFDSVATQQNPFDEFDAPKASNPFDEFDAVPSPAPQLPKPEMVEPAVDPFAVRSRPEPSPKLNYVPTESIGPSGTEIEAQKAALARGEPVGFTDTLDFRNAPAPVSTQPEPMTLEQAAKYTAATRDARAAALRRVQTGDVTPRTSELVPKIGTVGGSTLQSVLAEERVLRNLPPDEGAIDTSKLGHDVTLIEHLADKLSAPTAQAMADIQGIVDPSASAARTAFIQQSTAGQPAYRDSFWLTTVPQAFGSTAPIMMAGAINPAAGFAVATGQGAGSARREAYQAGASDATQVAAAIGGALLGASEALPLQRMLGRGGSGFVSRLIRGGLEEGLQEVGQTLGSNALAKALYDESRQLTEGVTEGGAAGFVVGSFLGGLAGKVERGEVTPQQAVSTVSQAASVLREAIKNDPAAAQQLFDAARASGDTEVVDALTEIIGVPAAPQKKFTPVVQTQKQPSVFTPTTTPELGRKERPIYPTELGVAQAPAADGTIPIGEQAYGAEQTGIPLARTEPEAYPVGNPPVTAPQPAIGVEPDIAPYEVGENVNAELTGIPVPRKDLAPYPVGGEPEAGGTTAPLPPPAPQGAPSATTPSVQEAAAKIPKGERKASTVKEAVAQMPPEASAQAAPNQQTPSKSDTGIGGLAVDENGNQIRVGDTVELHTLYGKVPVKVRGIVRGDKPMFAHQTSDKLIFDPVQVGPEYDVNTGGGFKPLTEWHVDNKMEKATLAQAAPPQSPVQTPQEPAPQPTPKKAKKVVAPEPVAQKEEVAQKEPWQMTEDEYVSSGLAEGGITEKHQSRIASGLMRDDHYEFVRDAVSEGKPVPSEVLSDYPDLAAKYAKVEVAQEANVAKQPWEGSKVEDENKWFGTKVTVMPQMKGDTGFKGTVTRVLNGGRLVEVRPEGGDGSFRVDSEFVKVDELAEQAPKGKPVEAAPSTSAGKPFLTAGDLAEHYKATGLNRTMAWDQYVIDTILSPRVRTEPVNAKEFFEAFDRIPAGTARPNPKMATAPQPLSPKDETPLKSETPKAKSFSADNLQEAFGVTGEEAAATVALADAMGLDTSRIEVVKGGKPGKGALKQSAAPVFYSKLRQVVEQKMGGAMDATQLRSMLTNNGVKPEEMEWANIESLAGKVTKQQVLDHLAENAVTVTEKMLGNEAVEIEATHVGSGDFYAHPASMPFREGMYFRLDEDGSYYTGGATDGFSDIDDALDYATEKFHSHGDQTKFGQYQLPGGTDYRELLLTLPVEKSPKSGMWSLWDTSEDVSVDVFDTKEQAEQALRQWRGVNDVAIVQTRRGDSVVPTTRQEAFLSSHYDEPNILAHVRFNTRTDGDGKKVLFIEEVQSDWHQKGREKGYADPKQDDELHKNLVKARQETKDRFEAAKKHAQANPGVRPDEDSQWSGLVQLHKEAVERQSALEDEILKLRDGIPNAPFKKTWHELVMKRMLRYAVDNGYDRVAWTTGEQQAERYDLSKHIDSIDWSGRKGERTWSASKDGKVVASGKESEAESYLGKEIAEKIVNSDGLNGELSGLDLKVGGEGMKGFYDKMLVTDTNKIIKKFGGRVGKNIIPVGPDESKRYTKYEDVHGFDITPAMREEVPGGLAMFQGDQASVEFVESGKALIRALESPNVSSGVHELAHVARRFLFNKGVAAANREGITDSEIDIAEKWAGAKNGKWSTASEEKFARGFERYLHDGHAPASKLASLFAKFKAWLGRIYAKLAGGPLDIDISDAMRGVYDKLVTRGTTSATPSPSLESPLKKGDKVLYKGKEAEVAYVPEDATKSISIRRGGRVFNADRKNVTRQAQEPAAPQPSPTSNTTTTKETPNASKVSSPKTPDGDVRTQPKQGQEKVSPKEGGEEVRVNTGEGTAEVREGNNVNYEGVSSTDVDDDISRIGMADVMRTPAVAAWMKKAEKVPQVVALMDAIENTVDRIRQQEGRPPWMPSIFSALDRDLSNMDRELNKTTIAKLTRLQNAAAKALGVKARDSSLPWRIATVAKQQSVSTPPQSNDVVAQPPAKESFVEMARRKHAEATNPFGPDVKPLGSGPNVRAMFWKAAEYAGRAINAGVKGVAQATKWAIDHYKQRQAQKLEVELAQKDFERFRSNVVKLLKAAVQTDRSFSENAMFKTLETLVGEKIVAPAVKAAKQEAAKVATEKAKKESKYEYRQQLEVLRLRAKAKGATEQGIREEVVRLAKEHLPPSIRGKMLNFVARTTTMARLSKAINYMRGRLAEFDAKQAVESIQRVASAKEMRNNKDIRQMLELARAKAKSMRRSGVDTDARVAISDEVEDIMRDAQALLHDAKRANEIYAEGKAQEAEAYRKGILETIKKHPVLKTEGADSSRADRGFFGRLNDRFTRGSTFYSKMGGKNAYTIMFDEAVKAEDNEARMLRDLNDAKHAAAKAAGYKNVLAADADISGALGQATQKYVTVATPLGDKTKIPLGQALKIAMSDPATKAMYDAEVQLAWDESHNKSFTLTPEIRSAIEDAVMRDHKRAYDYLRGVQKWSNEVLFPQAQEVHKKIKGYEMGDVSEYLPRKAERGPSTGPTMWTQMMRFHQENAGYTNKREVPKKIIIDDANAAVSNHAAALIKLINFAELTRSAEMVMNDSSVREQVASRYGEDAVKRIESDVANMSHGMDPTLDLQTAFERFMGSLKRRTAGAAVALNPISWAKNMVGGIVKMAGAFDNVSDHAAGMKSAMYHAANPGKSMKRMATDVPMLWRRYALAPHTLATAQVWGREPYLFEGTAEELRSAMKALARSVAKMNIRDIGDNLARAWDSIRVSNFFDAFSAAYAYGAAESKVSREQPSLSGQAKSDAIAHEVSIAMRTTQNSHSKTDIPPVLQDARSRPLLGLYFVFMSDKLQTYNMLKSGSKMAVGAALVSAILSSLIDTGREEWRKKEDDDSPLPKRYALNLASELAGTIPNLDKLVRIVEDLANERTDYTNIIDRITDPVAITETKGFLRGLYEVASAITREDKSPTQGKTVAEKVRGGIGKTLIHGSSLLGAPIGPMARLFEPLFRQEKVVKSAAEKRIDSRLNRIQNLGKNLEKRLERQ